MNHQLEYFQVLPAPPSLSKAQVRVLKVTGVYYPPWEMIHTSCLSVGPRFQLWLRVPRPAILRRRVCVCVCVCVCVSVCESLSHIRLFVTPWTWGCKPWSLLGSSVHEILQARILERVAISFSRASSQPRDRTRVSSIAGEFFTA